MPEQRGSPEYVDDADQIRYIELVEQYERLQRENAELREMARTKSACGHMMNFQIGDDGGHFTCVLCKLAAAEAALDEANSMLWSLGQKPVSVAAARGDKP